jgi:AcrR family transcriptional regulator
LGSPADSEKSRERLLSAAGEVFAEHGFRHATVRDICARAGQGLGAVSYHFGSKESLYAAVMQCAHPASMATYVASAVAAGRTPEDRLRSYVRVFLEHVFDERQPAWQGRLLIHELASPTAALDTFVRDCVRPHFELLRGIVAELLGPQADETTVVDHCASVIGQCVFYKQSRPIIERAMTDRRYDRADLERLADHLAEFSLAGIGASRGGLEARAGARPRRASGRR